MKHDMNEKVCSLTLSPDFREICPRFVGAWVVLTVDAGRPTPPALWHLLQREYWQLCRFFTPDTLKTRPGIAATRQAYKFAGKDPSRYRPACEQLARRVLQGKRLYSAGVLVDALNLVSLQYGYSTASLDADALHGNEVCLDLGREGEAYAAIGRGPLNIAQLPVYRDAAGPFASPTSDSERTKIRPATRRVVVIINGYDGELQNVREAAFAAVCLLRSYAAAHDVHCQFFPENRG